jgi:hypothetical protein
MVVIVYEVAFFESRRVRGLDLMEILRLPGFQQERERLSTYPVLFGLQKRVHYRLNELSRTGLA